MLEIKPQKKISTELLNARVSEDTADVIKNLAESHGTTISEVIRQMLEFSVSKLKKNNK